jgi:hypothetical protein
MDFTEIFSGMPQGPEAIQDNFKKISDNISDTGWTNSGITYLNGAKANKDGGLFYRKASLFGVGYLVELRGVVIAPSSAGSAYVIQLPQNITPAKVIFPTGKSINPDGRIYVYNYDASGNISIYYSYLVG